MKLFLASYIGHPDSVTKLGEYVGGFFGKSIAYIPTASNGENPFNDWQTNSATWNLVNTLDARVTAVQLEDYKNSSVIDQLRSKDILWFAGGVGGYLMYWIRRCELDKALPDLLKKSLYVGSSAGSMITARSLAVGEWLEEPGASCIPGLGFVDFDIYPHYDDSHYDQIKQKYTGKKLYLLKNGEEIIWEDGKIELIGQERIIQN